MTRLLGGIEAGGTKIGCVVGTGPDDIRARTLIATTTPDETISSVLEFYSDQSDRLGPISSLGVASFGPLELRTDSPQFGYITRTTKPGWSHTDILGPIRDVLRVPVVLDTDVNGAAMGEWRWGAGRGLGSFVYLTVGTGIGGAAILHGQPVHGLIHPEMGHMRVPRHPDDDYDGMCLYHGSCLEGMASGPAIADRWGRPPDQLGDLQEQAIRIEAHYLALAIANLVYTLAVERAIVGGGVSHLRGLLPAVLQRLSENLGDYPGLPEHTSDDFVVRPGLGDDAGVVGALALAEQAVSS